MEGKGLKTDLTLSFLKSAKTHGLVKETVVLGSVSLGGVSVLSGVWGFGGLTVGSQKSAHSKPGVT